MLIIFSGLPGTGKSTIAKQLVAQRMAAYVRIDEIEQALKRSIGDDVGPGGYFAGYAVAASNLELDVDVVADSVNPIPESREGWRGTAERVGKPFVEIEVVCSDKTEHRRRVEYRKPDIAGLAQPSWLDVVKREYIARKAERLVLDTAQLGVEEAVAQIEAYIAANSG